MHQQSTLGFSRAYLELPEFFNASGANVSIYDIVLTAQNGLSIGGAGFTLPDFKLGEFGFKNIYILLESCLPHEFFLERY